MSIYLRSVLSRPFPMALLAFLFVVSIHLPTAQATWDAPELDELTQLYAEVFGTSIEDGMPVELIAPFQGAGIQFLIAPDGSARTFEVVSAVDITTQVSDGLVEQGETLDVLDQVWATIGWLEAMNGASLGVTAIVRSNEIEGTWLYLTGSVDDDFLYAIADSPSDIAESTSENVGVEIGLIDVKAHVLQQDAVVALEAELLSATSNLHLTLAGENDEVAMEQAILVHDDHEAQKRHCAVVRDTSNATALNNLNIAIAAANNAYTTAVNAAVSTRHDDLVRATVLLAICLVGLGWYFAFLGVAVCLMGYALEVDRIRNTYNSAIAAALLAWRARINAVWSTYYLAIGNAKLVYESCMAQWETTEQTQLTAILDTCSPITQSAILAAHLEASMILENFDKSRITTFNHSEYDIFDEVLLVWPAECFE